MENERLVVIAGNPNVGKSTVFNALTNLHQHTGNWTGKTVSNAAGFCQTTHFQLKMIDIPGTYSLMAHSAEEEVARDFICFEAVDAVVVVCDATCLERNLNLVIQIMEVAAHVIVCVNLMDEAEKKKIRVDIKQLSKQLAVPVVGMVARDKRGVSELLGILDEMLLEPGQPHFYHVPYCAAIEQAIKQLIPTVEESLTNEKNRENRTNPRWATLRLLESNEYFAEKIRNHLGVEQQELDNMKHKEEAAQRFLRQNKMTQKRVEEEVVSSLLKEAKQIAAFAVSCESKRPDEKDRKIDRILTSKWAGYPLMAALLMAVLWITISGANYPSKLLSEGLFYIQDRLTELFVYVGAPNWLHGMLVLGIYRVLAWVVSVMLPPMAIFFPLFTLLEDSGYLPRIAYNLDKPFQKCCACGKQALTMCMGFVYLQLFQLNHNIFINNHYSIKKSRKTGSFFRQTSILQ